MKDLSGGLRHTYLKAGMKQPSRGGLALVPSERELGSRSGIGQLGTKLGVGELNTGNKTLAPSKCWLEDGAEVADATSSGAAPGPLQDAWRSMAV